MFYENLIYTIRDKLQLKNYLLVDNKTQMQLLEIELFQDVNIQYNGNVIFLFLVRNLTNSDCEYNQHVIVLLLLLFA